MQASAAHFGIGVLLYDGRRTEVRVKAAERRLPASYGSWLVNEWTVRRAGKSLP